MSAPMRASVGAAAATRDLWQLAETDDTTELEQILLRGADINAVDSAGTTVLMRAAHHGCAQMVRALIERGANLNATRADGFNPLMLAAFFGHAHVVKVLVQCGADLNGVTRFNTSAEMWAAVRSFFDIADYLRDARNTMAQNSEPETFLDNGAEVATTEEVTPFLANSHEVATTEEVNSFLDIGPKVATTEEVSPFLANGSAVATTEEVNPNDPPIVAEREKEPEVTLQHIVPVHNDRVAAPEGVMESVAVPIVRTLKEPPEIWDLVHETPPQFNAGSAFITRLTSSSANLVIAGLLVFLVSTTSIYAFLKFRRHPMFNTSAAPAVSVSDKQQPASVRRSPSANATSVTAVSNGETEVQAVTPSLVENNAGQDVLSLPARKTSHAGRGRLPSGKEIYPNVLQNGPSNSSGATLATRKATTETSANPGVRSGDRENTASSSVKKPLPTTLSPQLIAPSTSANPARKAKVIQWP